MYSLFGARIFSGTHVLRLYVFPTAICHLALSKHKEGCYRQRRSQVKSFLELGVEIFGFQSKRKGARPRRAYQVA